MLKDLPREALFRPLTRNEVVGMLVRLTIFGAATYYSIKWVLDAMDPTAKQKNQAKKRAEQLMKRIGVEGVKLTEYEMNIASHLVDPQTMRVSWRDIAGLDEIINELQDTVILPFQKRHLLTGSKLFQPPKGVLLFGPPGCGKTMIAKATAKASGCKFINLQASTLTDMWYGESQKLTAAVFSLAIKLQPCIIFIDEIESFLRNRSSLDHEATAMMKAQFMSLWDGLETSSATQVMIMGATNRPQDMDPAILRRMPTTFHVGLPNTRQRQDILRLILAEESLSNTINLKEIAEKTEGYSGSDLRELCRDAAFYRVRDYVRKEQMRQITQQLGEVQEDENSVTEEQLRPVSQLDLLFGLDKMRESKRASVATLPATAEVPLD
ncbi:outer mitochondrial transmembrane helix translocase [Nerophis ophidion]|uniref:outer mitochondrial transmembrane helix translocase n=1 Tax=Nerophis ophidion TaxID=159077 RepID=UPI002ADFAD39|nr:outer mitochondrial transmembrane helix translocase [Nerophis ophidion]XP_061763112.1 outer mitochondrial transmembrane helix translocase [Nerophis ophidion]XP_061763113.1 outer mitochondrial transmembrane helix translocase [Nerophis ophidion]